MSERTPIEVMLHTVNMHTELVRDLLTARDAVIRVAQAQGESLREIATAAGLTHPGIKKILEREESAA